MGPRVFQVADDVWCLRRGSYLTCSYLVQSRAGIILIDAGMDSTGADVRVALHEAFAAKPGDIAAVLLTHWHNDHAAGARFIQDRSDAQVYYHHADEPQLDGTTAARGARGWIAAQIPERGPLVLFKGLLGEATPNPIRRGTRVEDGERILSDFEVIATPGHTPGHVSFYFHPARALFAGDALAVVAGRIRFMARPVTPDVDAARTSMIRCLERDLSLLCPGHRDPMRDGANAERKRMHAALIAGARWPLLG